jgi:hypothetical protein
MSQLPPDFAESLARVVDPRQHAAVAEVIEAATRLDDERLGLFLERFAARIRSSPEPVTHEELLEFLRVGGGI